MFALKLLLMLASLIQLTETELFHAPYILVFAVGLLAALELHKEDKRLNLLSGWRKGLCIGAATVFTLMIAATNYSGWLEPPLGAATPKILKILYGFTMLCVYSGGTYAAFLSVLEYLAFFPDRIAWTEATWAERRQAEKNAFWICFAGICAVNLFVLFFLKYPGILTGDTFNQINQVLTGRYNNHHPFFHTILLKPCIALGMGLFHDLNAGVAIYCVGQILFMAAVFSYVVRVIVRLGAPRWAVIAVGAYYMLAPFHIMFSISVWKSIIFSGWVTLFCLKQFELLQDTRHSFLDYAVYAAACIGACLFRSNGMIAMLISLMVFVLCFGTKQKRTLGLFLLCVVFSFALKHTLLSALNIPQPDTVESLSVPVQQIARTVVEHNDLTEDESRLLNRVIPVEKIDGVYVADYSDPIKNLIRATRSGQGDLEGWPMEYVGLYLRLGLRHPVTYIKAWIDQTSGYWSSGYTYPQWSSHVFPNSLGLENRILLPRLSSMFDYALGTFDDFGFFEYLRSPGLFLWLSLLMVCFGLLRSDKQTILISIPGIAVTATLLLATPMANEFAYIYSLFCVFPLALVVATRPLQGE